MNSGPESFSMGVSYRLRALAMVSMCVTSDRLRCIVWVSTFVVALPLGPVLSSLGNT